MFGTLNVECNLDTKDVVLFLIVFCKGKSKFFKIQHFLKNQNKWRRRGEIIWISIYTLFHRESFIDLKE